MVEEGRREQKLMSVVRTEMSLWRLYLLEFSKRSALADEEGNGLSGSGL